MRNSLALLALNIALLLVPRLAAAQLAPMATDRPGNGNAAAVVAHGVLLIETGANFSHDSTAGSAANQLALPTALRLGLGGVFEFRVGSELFRVYQPADSVVVSGTDFYAGFKVLIGRDKPSGISMAVSVQGNFPVGGEAVTSDGYDIEARVLLGWSRGPYSILFNIGGEAVAPEDSDRFGRGVYDLLLAYALPFWSQRLTVFVEAFGRPAPELDRSVNQFDWGLLAGLTPDLQLDLFVQHGLHQAATALQIGLGLSYRGCLFC
ncbi:MAG: transporter [Deltaproteobacteria bacterium]|nr:transporter [Deltaproteobacteria bacterium]